MSSPTRSPHGFGPLLEGLNTEQREAVTHSEGPVLVDPRPELCALCAEWERFAIDTMWDKLNDDGTGED